MVRSCCLKNFFVVLLIILSACTKEAQENLAALDPTDSSMSKLSFSAGTLVPDFDSETTVYTMSVPYSVSQLTLTPTLGSAISSMKINGNAFTLAMTSEILPLAEGANTIVIEVTSADESSTRTYNIDVTRAIASTDNNLTSLTISPGVLTPSFSSGEISYTTLISDLASAVQVTPVTSNSGASLEISWNGGAYTQTTSGEISSSLTPAMGTNSLSLRVTSESGAQKIYSISVTYNICGAGYYDDGTHACIPVGIGYYSALNDNTRTACTNMPANASYTSPTAASSSCPWSCVDGYLTTDGVSCNSYPNATVLSCDSDEVAVGLYGRSGAIIDRLGVRCASFTDGSIGSTVRNGPYYGGTGGSAFSEDCAANSTAFEVDGDFATYVAESRTGRLRYRCADVDTSALGAWSPAASYWGSSTGLGAFNYACGSGANPYGNYINGIIIDNAGGASYVGRILGITCR